MANLASETRDDTSAPAESMSRLPVNDSGQDPRQEDLWRQLPLYFVRLDKGLPLPHRAHATDAGIDLFSTIDINILPGQRILVPTGVAIGLPNGTVGLIHPRSGLAYKHGLSIVNAPGTIDEGYQGEIKVCLINLDRSIPIEIRRGDRIAQLIIQKVEYPHIVEIDAFTDITSRGCGGYGSTGGHSALGVETQ